MIRHTIHPKPSPSNRISCAKHRTTGVYLWPPGVNGAARLFSARFMEVQREGRSSADGRAWWSKAVHARDGGGKPRILRRNINEPALAGSVIRQYQ